MSPFKLSIRRVTSCREDVVGSVDKAGRVIFGVFGNAIDDFGVRFGGNHFALEIEVKDWYTI